MNSNIAIYAPGQSFVTPYFKAGLPECGIYSMDITGGKISLTPENKLAEGEPSLYVMISSTEIYRSGNVENADESTLLDGSENKWADDERAFASAMEGTAKPVVVLRCADIVCTGMQGFPRRLVQAVARGTFFHFPGNEARRSVAHAVDLPRAVGVMLEAGIPAGTSVYNLSDGTDPTIHDLAEAFAYRLNNKRISNLSTRPQQWFGRLVYGNKKYGEYTTTRTFSGEKLRRDFNFGPTVVTEYLRTHVYDENSL